MKCPICGCKMKEEFMCPYCKITGEQVKTASNKKAKECIKNKNTKNVYNSTYLPKDVNNTRLMLITLFGGLFGAHHFYIGRFKLGILYLISFLQCLIIYSLSELIFIGNKTLELILDASYIIAAIFMLMWISDFLKVCLKRLPIPVVLGEANNKRSK